MEGTSAHYIRLPQSKKRHNMLLRAGRPARRPDDCASTAKGLGRRPAVIAFVPWPANAGLPRSVNRTPPPAYVKYVGLAMQRYPRLRPNLTGLEREGADTRPSNFALPVTAGGGHPGRFCVNSVPVLVGVHIGQCNSQVGRAFGLPPTVSSYRSLLRATLECSTRRSLSAGATEMPECSSHVTSGMKMHASKRALSEAGSRD